MKKENIKCICSCIRNEKQINDDLIKSLCEENINPKSGDVVVVKVLDASYGYSTIENTCGRNVHLYNHDIIVCVLGNRKSGTNIFGVVPKTRLTIGDRLDLLAQGGIVGNCINVDRAQRKAQAMHVEILGFVQAGSGKIENIHNFAMQDKIEIANFVPTVVIFGTSAEVGKTTLMCRILSEIKKNYDINISCIKVCGTGRFKDLLAYKDAGANFCADFVDFGIPSTYDLSEREYNDTVTKLYNAAKVDSDLILIEVGGDILEGNADIFLKISKENKYNNILVINDAMGGRYGMTLFGDYNFSIFSWKQNIFSLKNRLNKDEIYSFSELDINKFLIEQVGGNL